MRPLSFGMVSRVVVEVLGKSKPLVLLLRSRIALALGEDVPMPTWAEAMVHKPMEMNKRK